MNERSSELSKEGLELTHREQVGDPPPRATTSCSARKALQLVEDQYGTDSQGMRRKLREAAGEGSTT